MARTLRQEGAGPAVQLVRLRPPQVALALATACVGVHFVLGASARTWLHCLVCGVAAAVAGFGIMTWAWWLFRRADTPVRPTDRAARLVTKGPFRYTRNPMYVGIVLMLLGLALAVGSWPMLVAPAAFLALISLVFIPHEEQALREIFGDEYAAYTARVRRWL